MHRLDSGWKVYDVVVADLSLVQNYRGSFETEVRKGGIDGLIKALADKNRQLSSMQAAADKK
jgi:phospholipid transport system substrate-binding protein